MSEMNRKVKMKSCEICKSVEIIESHNRKYCPDCIKERDRRHGRKQARKKSRAIRERLDKNFIENNYEKHHLTPLGFNEASPISYQSYHNHFRMTWREILKRYDKEDEFTCYLLSGYRKFYKETGNYGMEEFEKYIKVSQAILDTYDHDIFRNSVGAEYLRHTSQSLRQNFMTTVENLGRLPLTNEEFAEHSKIHIQTYVRHYKIKENHLETIVGNYVPKEEYDTYLKAKKKAMEKAERKRVTMLNGIYEKSDEEVERITRETVDQYIEKHQQIPSLAEFDSLSGMRVQTLRRRYGKTYRELIEGYGYDTRLWKIKRHSKESMVIDAFEKILKCKGQAQVTFEWLKGGKGWALRCDSYFSDYGLVVEYDGEGHTLPVDFAGRGEDWALNALKETQRNDAIKNHLIPKNGLTLIRIGYDEPYWDEDFLRVRLLEHGVTPPNHTIALDSIDE